MVVAIYVRGAWLAFCANAKIHHIVPGIDIRNPIFTWDCKLTRRISFYSGIG